MSIPFHFGSVEGPLTVGSTEIKVVMIPEQSLNCCSPAPGFGVLGTVSRAYPWISPGKTMSAIFSGTAVRIFEIYILSEASYSLESAALIRQAEKLLKSAFVATILLLSGSPEVWQQRINLRIRSVTRLVFGTPTNIISQGARLWLCLDRAAT